MKLYKALLGIIFIFTIYISPVNATQYFTGGSYSCNDDGNSACSNSVDGNNTTAWVTNNILPADWWYDFGTGIQQEITEVTINGYADPSHSLNIIKDFSIRGSNNFSSWTTLHTVTSFAQDDSNKVYTITSPNLYRYYNIHITANYRGDSYSGLAEVTATACTNNCVIPDPPPAGVDANIFGTSTATSTPTLGDVALGLGIIIVLFSIFVITYIWNLISDKKKKPWR